MRASWLVRAACAPLVWAWVAGGSAAAAPAPDVPWAEGASAAVQRAAAAAPASLAAEVDALRPTGTTRDGRPRLLTPLRADPEAAPLLLRRALDPAEPAPLRQALLVAAWSAWSAGQGPDWALLRAAGADDALAPTLLDLAARGPAPAEVLVAAAADARAPVRAAALRALAAHPELPAAVAVSAARAALSDVDVAARAEASRLLGVRGGTADLAALRALLTDPEPRVRAAVAAAVARLEGGGESP
jgi:hypothetical protein